MGYCHRAEQNRFRGHTDSDSDHKEIASLAYSIDGTIFASGSWDNTIRLWDANTGAHLKTLIGHESSVNSIAFSPDGKTLASGSQDETIRLWDIATGTLLKTYKAHSNDVYSVVFSPDGTMLASGGRDNTIRLWELLQVNN